MNNWQPIDTAPKDCAYLGYERITSGLWLIAPMYWDGRRFALLSFFMGELERTMKPTHWQPLPDPPEDV